MGEFNVVENQLDYQFLLLVHIICADGQLHSEELKDLENLAQKSKIGQSTRDEMNKIIGCDDNHLSLEYLADRIDRSQRNEIMRQMMVVDYAYGSFSPSKEKIIDRVANCWNWDLWSESKKKKKLLDEAKKIANIAVNFNYQKTSSQTNQSKIKKKPKHDRVSAENKIKGKEKQNSANSNEKDNKIYTQKENLLDEVEYQEAIYQCSKTAEEDYKYAELALNKTGSTLYNLADNLQQAIAGIKYRNSTKGKANTAKEVAKQLESSTESLDTEIIKDIEQVEESLNAKKRATKYFTIAFMGKTKAGKSTLHAIITQGGWDAIGVGKQRTTRENREYKWKNIRIVDTPGIGAPGGKTDEEIAESIIEESDVICYVVTSDSIQETEFQFLKLLKEKTKPLIILLNIKKNLQDSRRLEHFLKDPNKLFAKEGKSGIQGHLNRINEYAEKYYNNNYFSIVPVMLLAAQISSKPENENNKDKLYQASRIQDFLNSIRESIIKHGAIRRSQTFLGSTVGNIQKFDNWITGQLEAYQKLSNTLKNKRQKVSREIEEAKEDTLEYLEQEIEAIFRDAFDRVPKFAEYYWDEDEEELNDAWNDELYRIKFESRLKNAFKNAGVKFDEQVQEILEEIGKELQLISQLRGGSFSLEEQDKTSFRNFMRIGGSVLALTGIALSFVLPPLGIVMGIVGGLMSFFGGLFEDRNAKRRKAVKKISKSLSKQLKKQKEKVLTQANKDFTKYCSDFANNIQNYFDELIEGLDAISTQLETAKSKLDNTINYLNCGFAKRIIEFACEEKYQPLTVKNVRAIIAKVQRNFGNHMTINIKSELDLKISEAEISQILQEDISIQVK